MKQNLQKSAEEKQVRTCIVTGEKHHKADMIRIVSFRGGNILLDLTGKKEGRGCYVSAKHENLEKLLEKGGSLIARNFKRQIKPEELVYLKEEFPKIVDEKFFRPRTSKPVAIRIKRDDLKKIVNG